MLPNPEYDRVAAELTPELIDRFWARVVRSDNGCWDWTGFKNKKGYGKFQVGEKSLGAHRVAYILMRGLFDSSLLIDHQCRNRGCCNPAHLRPVTVRENTLENSASPPAANAAKTHCKRGHPFDEHNTAIDGLGHRRCRVCIRGAGPTSGYRGVRRAGFRWFAQLTLSTGRVRSKRFEMPEDAARDYDRMALATFGSRAILNFPQEHTELDHD